MTWFHILVVNFTKIIIAFVYSFTALLAFSMYIHREVKK